MRQKECKYPHPCSTGPYVSIASWDIKTGQQDWGGRRHTKPGSRYPHGATAEYIPAPSPGVCWCYHSWEQVMRGKPLPRSWWKVGKWRTAVCTLFPKVKIVQLRLLFSQPFDFHWTYRAMLFLNAQQWGRHPTHGGFEERNACAEGDDKWEAKSYQDVLFHNVIMAHFKIL